MDVLDGSDCVPVSNSVSSMNEWTELSGLVASSGPFIRPPRKPPDIWKSFRIEVYHATLVVRRRTADIDLVAQAEATETVSDLSLSH